MNDLPNLLEALKQSTRSGLGIVMATVVKVEGSAYRRPGARMIIPQSGAIVGTVSGGCLERDVARKAWWFTTSGKPAVRIYTTGEDDDDLEEAELAFGLGCNGTVHILFERLPVGGDSIVVRLLEAIGSSGRPAALATVISTEANEGVAVGDRMAIGVDGTLCGSLIDASLSAQVEVDLGYVLESRRTTHCDYVTDKGHVVGLLIEYIAPPCRLVVFGAGNDAKPLVDIASLQGWRVVVVDARSHFARRERFPLAEQVIIAPIDEPFIFNSLVEDAAVVIMSHSMAQDRFWLENVLRCLPRYIGQLGPRTRTERLLAEMGAQVFHSIAFETLHFPVGLDIGGDTPESVALSISSEINAVFSQRDGGMLTHRTRSIHEAEILNDKIRSSNLVSEQKSIVL